MGEGSAGPGARSNSPSTAEYSLPSIHDQLSFARPLRPSFLFGAVGELRERERERERERGAFTATFSQNNANVSRHLVPQPF
ncbi:hypothetical protein GOP47_0019719 [Adiantum capillus-veneris]|uniref:Uncharacterized protein n=1 Tax=Adiantum capillus-veneris TaxID=13818 RepID=A0A9D4UD27_ADICA|nr:hypothetical protein GOP47_0019719 [Adiantum capillus-veneris]